MNQAARSKEIVVMQVEEQDLRPMLTSAGMVGQHPVRILHGQTATFLTQVQRDLEIEPQ